jgi:hypothetical protein
VDQIFAWIQFSNAHVGDVVEWDWYDPTSAKQTSTATIGFTGGGCAWASVGVAGNVNANKTGVWTVNYLYNGVFQSSNSFQLNQWLTDLR